MPNWCSNQLMVKHDDPKMVEKFVEACKSETGLFGSFVPRPENDPDWYQWSLDNWGTKWDVQKPTFDFTKSSKVIELSFETAWGPPTAFYQHLVTLGFKVRAYYREEGMGFHGRFHEDYGDSCEDIMDMPGTDDLFEEEQT